MQLAWDQAGLGGVPKWQAWRIRGRLLQVLYLCSLFVLGEACFVAGWTSDVRRGGYSLRSKACVRDLRTFGCTKARSMKMATKTRFCLTGKSRDSYLELVQDFPLASIKSEPHLTAAQGVMDSLLVRGTLDEGAETYLNALSDLVGAYEDEKHAIEPASDADMLRHLMEAKGVSQAQLCRDTGLPKSTISEILAGKKPFSRQMMRTLADYFRVDASVMAANI